MAKPLKTGKQSVDLASREARPSKIRRDPPPKVKELVIRDPRELERRDVVIGVLVFALAIFVIILAAGSYWGWSPRDYTIHVQM